MKLKDSQSQAPKGWRKMMVQFIQAVIYLLPYSEVCSEVPG